MGVKEKYRNVDYDAFVRNVIRQIDYAKSKYGFTDLRVCHLITPDILIPR